MPAGWIGPRLGNSRRLRTDPDFRAAWERTSAALSDAARARLQRQQDAGVLRGDVALDVLAAYLELLLEGLVSHLAMGLPVENLGRVLDLVEASVRR